MYNLAIYSVSIFVKIAAVFNAKLRLGVKGRKTTFKTLQKELKDYDNTLWFHCASLGEYEQGLPVFEALRSKFPNHKIVLSFFSPSGYEIRKNTKIADVVVYMPLDTKQNAITFLNLTNPSLVIFVKYDIWPNFLNEIKKRRVRALLISAVFRPRQVYFKWYGATLKNALFAFDHIFVQSPESKEVLKKINYNAVTVSGDTRFDRVISQLEQKNDVEGIGAFKQEALCIVIGSSWPQDETLLVPFINKHSSTRLKFIIAPHNINHLLIEKLQKALRVKSVLYSQRVERETALYNVLIIDSIGLLSKIYSYADIAFVGGAVGNTGLHNILEPAVFGVPILIGKNHHKFPESLKMIAKGGVQSIKDYKELEKALLNVIHNRKELERRGNINKNFVVNNKGAVNHILDYLEV